MGWWGAQHVLVTREVPRAATHERHRELCSSCNKILKWCCNLEVLHGRGIPLSHPSKGICGRWTGQRCLPQLHMAQTHWKSSVPEEKGRKQQNDRGNGGENSRDK